MIRALSTVLHRWFLYPVVLGFRGELETYPFLRDLRSMQWRDREEVRARQARCLANCLTHAVRTVPYYRERWNFPGPVAPDEAFEVLRELPVLTKKELQRESAALVSEACPWRTTRKTTGGSTGQPVSVVKDRSAVARERAASWLGWGWFGVEIGDRGARFWGSPTDLGARRFRFAAADLAMNRIRFSAFAFDEDDLETYWERCLRWSPDYFYGYVSMLTQFARHVRERGHDGTRLDLKVVITTAEALAAPQRKLLEDVFDAPVQDEYGCGEVGPIAYECPEGSLHVMAANTVVELVGNDDSTVAAGESGHVVITDLSNRAMPLVRYRVGDRAVKGRSCRCGRGLPVLQGVQGRAYDFVRDRAGRRYHGEYFMYLFEDLRDRGVIVDQFRVTQISEDQLVLEIVRAGKMEASHMSRLRQRIARDMEGMRVRVVSVVEIEPLESGKSRLIRNCLLDGESTI